MSCHTPWSSCSWHRAGSQTEATRQAGRGPEWSVLYFRVEVCGLPSLLRPSHHLFPTVAATTRGTATIFRSPLRLRSSSASHGFHVRHCSAGRRHRLKADGHRRCRVPADAYRRLLVGQQSESASEVQAETVDTGTNSASDGPAVSLGVKDVCLGMAWVPDGSILDGWHRPFSCLFRSVE